MSSVITVQMLGMTTLLASVRLAALFLLTPLFAVVQVPVRVRVFFLLAIAFLLVLSLQVQPVKTPLSVSDLMKAIISEALVGAVLAFGPFAAFGAFLFGGRLLDFQMGFGVANLIDPTTNTQAPLLGTALNLVGVVTFFLVNGHHVLIRGVAYSLEKVPLGASLEEINLAALVMQFGFMFIYGIAIVAPAIMFLLLLDAGMAVASRMLPQVNMFIFGIPIKIAVGLAMVAVSLNYMPPLLEKVYASIFQYWKRILG